MVLNSGILMLLMIIKECIQIRNIPTFETHNYGNIKEDNYRIVNYNGCCFCYKTVGRSYSYPLNNYFCMTNLANIFSKNNLIVQPLQEKIITDKNLLNNKERMLFPHLFNVKWEMDNQSIQSFKNTRHLYSLKNLKPAPLTPTVIGNEILTVPASTPNAISTRARLFGPLMFPNTLSFFTPTQPKKEINKLRRSSDSEETNTSEIPASIIFRKSGFVEKIPHSRQKQDYIHALNKFERKFYSVMVNKLFSISSKSNRHENGISFVESGFFLFLILSALSVEVNEETKSEIDSCLGLRIPDVETKKIITSVLDNLPASSNELKFRWSTRLVVNGTWTPSHSVEQVLRLRVKHLNGSESTEQLLETLNKMVEHDSGGAMRDTFEEDELSEGTRSVLIQTLYLRARWRAAPTLLNGTRLFRDAPDAVPRTARMIRINDMMRYADLTEWDAQAVEILYSTPGLSLLLVVPRGLSLRELSARAAEFNVNDFTADMRLLRVAVTLPIYTLRMTLLLPNKLQDMGISHFFSPNNTKSEELRLSHAVQRLMFWAEAGGNAFKDDGIEWDHSPELEMVVDRPYLFYVRWQNLTLMNGHFVL